MRLAGAAPKLHAIIAPMQTCIAILMLPAVREFFRRINTGGIAAGEKCQYLDRNVADCRLS
jgi:hypothetical protein